MAKPKEKGVSEKKGTSKKANPKGSAKVVNAGAEKSGKSATKPTANRVKPRAKLLDSKKRKPSTPNIAGKNKATLDKTFVKASPKDAQETINILCKTYPDAHCELDYKTTFQLLISVILSAQTTDTGVNRVTPKLFQRFPDAKALAEADIEEVKAIIRPTGYFNAKANNIQRCAQALVEKHKGEIPKTVEALTQLPGVGKKTANVILGVAYGEPAWTVDTHVQRLSRRLGFTDETDPLKIESALQKLFPKQDWSQYSITIIWHGRRLCFARKPDCANCPVNHLCPSSQV